MLVTFVEDFVGKRGGVQEVGLRAGRGGEAGSSSGPGEMVV